MIRISKFLGFSEAFFSHLRTHLRAGQCQSTRAIGCESDRAETGRPSGAVGMVTVCKPCLACSQLHMFPEQSQLVAPGSGFRVLGLVPRPAQLLSSDLSIVLAGS